MLEFDQKHTKMSKVNKTSLEFNKVYKNVKYCKQDGDQTDLSPIL